MSDIDKRGKLTENRFSYKSTKEGKIFISYQNRQIMILKEKKAAALLTKLQSKDSQQVQLILAKVTGHFKHWNEKPEKK